MTLDQKSGRWLALTTLLLLLIIIYFLFFHWFFVAHATLNEEVQSLNDSRQKFINEAAKTPLLREKILQVKQTVGDNDEFLVANSENLGNAEITAILKRIVNEQSVDQNQCQLISQAPTQDREPQQFEKIILRVRMRCQYDIFTKVLQQVEENKPTLFLDDLNIDSRQVQQYRRGQQQMSEELLEIRFILYAYMKKAVVSKDEN